LPASKEGAGKARRKLRKEGVNGPYLPNSHTHTGIAIILKIKTTKRAGGGGKHANPFRELTH